MPHDHHIFTEPVEEILTLRPGLVKIVVSRTDIVTGEVAKFAPPIQWEPREAAALMHEIRGCSWQLADDGTPLDLETIQEVCKKYLKPKECE